MVDPHALHSRLRPVVGAWRDRGHGPVLVLTGAGISAESGIPTFRGDEGYWTVGSVNHRPMELATQAMFRRDPATVWEFYLSRIVRHRDAAPNTAHRALVDLEEVLGDDFLLVTQNVDGLHRRAGQSPARTYCIHGDLGRVRCATACGVAPTLLPEALVGAAAQSPEGAMLGDPRVRDGLRCAHCGGWLRPHVLWFDEYYDEVNFRWDSTLAAAEHAALLVVVGTSGATNLPNHVVATACARGVPLLVIGLDDTPFSRAAERTPTGAFLRGTATGCVPPLVGALAEAAAEARR